MSEVFRIKDIDPIRLDAERQRVFSLLCRFIQRDNVYEIGSTAIPGVVGKQDLDFLVLVTANDFIATRSLLDEQFHRNHHQLSDDAFQGYIIESSIDVAVQLTIAGGPYDHFLDFLHQLKHNATLREKYNELKMAFEGCPISKYREAKRQFIEHVLRARQDGSALL